VNPTALSNASFFRDYIYSMPLSFNKDTPITQLGVNVDGAQGATGVLGIYSPGPNGMPQNLVVQTAALALVSSQATMGAVSTTLPPGMYWISLLIYGGTANPTLKAVPPTSSLTILGQLNSDNAASAGTVIRQAASGATTLPSVYPTTGFSTFDNSMPRVLYKVD